jgi:hypothetical protein
MTAELHAKRNENENCGLSVRLLVFTLLCLFVCLPKTHAVVTNGFSSPAPDEVGVSTNSVERLRIDSSGRVGIGTSTPAALLDLTGTSATTSALIVPRASTASRPSAPLNGMLRYNLDLQMMEAFVNGSWASLATGGGVSSQWTTAASNIYFATGKVGIGTTAPLQILDVVGNARFAMSTGDAITLTGNFGGASTGLIQSLYGVVYLSNNIKDAGSFVNSFTAGSYISQGSSFGIDFVVAPGAASPTLNTAMRIQHDGKIGIGTTSPGQRLEINGGIRLNTGSAKPTCDGTVRGTLWVTQAAAGVKDNVEVCAKDAADAYSWRVLY